MGKKWKDGAAILLLLMFGVYLAAVAWINFDAPPSFYDADMYSDVLYAVQVREEKTIFPQNWVFGNQLNAVSPPVLAAIIDGIHGGGMFVSVAWASTLMTLATLWAFDWMLRPVLRSWGQRLMCLTMFMTVVLYCGGAVDDNRGWSLFFTMCAYYAGYSITAFLAFGCYIRAGYGLNKNLAAVLMLTCVLSFGTGIQSIRQTAIMVVPLAAAEGLRILVEVLHHRQMKKPQLLVASAIAVSNLAGLICAKMVKINQVEILGSIELTEISAIPEAIGGCFMVMLRMMVNSSRSSYLVLAVMAVICLGALPTLWKNRKQEQSEPGMTLFFLLTMGVLVIVGIDIMTTMHVWGRYYFLLYPLIAFLVAYSYDQHKKLSKAVTLGFLTVLFFLSCLGELGQVYREYSQGQEDPAYEISAYLQEHGYQYLFSVWGHGEGVAVVSEGEIMVGFWDLQEEPFKPMGYLYHPVIFEAAPEQCAYLFDGEAAVDIARDRAKAAGTELELLHYFEKYDFYLFTAPVNLMNAYA